MNADILKRINITEQINAYISENRFQEIVGNKKADCIRQDNQSAQLSIHKEKESNHHQYNTALPCVTLPIVARYHADAGQIVENLSKETFKGHFNHTVLRQLTQGLFVASFGRYGEHNLHWEIEKYIDEIKANQAPDGVTP